MACAARCASLPLRISSGTLCQGEPAHRGNDAADAGHGASARKHKQFTLLTFTEFADMDAVLPFKGHDLSVPAAAVKPLTEPDTYYYRDIIGLTVIDDTGATLGKVSEILTPGPTTCG